MRFKGYIEGGLLGVACGLLYTSFGLAVAAPAVAFAFYLVVAID